LLQLTQFHQYFKGSDALVAIRLGFFIAPGVVTEAADGDQDTDQGNRITLQLFDKTIFPVTHAGPPHWYTISVRVGTSL
jgi:hypothetical protein